MIRIKISDWSSDAVDESKYNVGDGLAWYKSATSHFATFTFLSQVSKENHLIRKARLKEGETIENISFIDLKLLPTLFYEGAISVELIAKAGLCHALAGQNKNKKGVFYTHNIKGITDCLEYKWENFLSKNERIILDGFEDIILFKTRYPERIPGATSKVDDPSIVVSFDRIDQIKQLWIKIYNYILERDEVFSLWSDGKRGEDTLAELELELKKLSV